MMHLWCIITIPLRTDYTYYIGNVHDNQFNKSDVWNAEIPSAA